MILIVFLFLLPFIDGPPTPLSQSPPSASCSPFTTGSYYASGQVFFPRTPANTIGGRNAGRVFFQQTPAPQPYPPMPQPQPTPGSANSHSSSSGVSSSLDTPSCSSGTPHYHQGQLQPIQFNWHDDGDSSESEGSSSQTTSTSSGCSPHCLGGTMDGGGSSFSMPSSANLISPSSSGGTLYASVPPHLDFMAGREQLQEFPGKIPQRKRKSRTPKPKKAGVIANIRLPEQLLNMSTNWASMMVSFIISWTQQQQQQLQPVVVRIPLLEAAYRCCRKQAATEDALYVYVYSFCTAGSDDRRTATLTDDPMKSVSGLLEGTRPAAL
uniref:Uncharacterized protein n=1 Tax=Anopheles maculatus TaxID=74869 RepID=A0A182SPV0_9DIPT